MTTPAEDTKLAVESSLNLTVRWCLVTTLLNLLRCYGALFFACLPVAAAERWIAVSTPHFEMYTTNNEKQATRALATFEQVRYFFLQRSSNTEASETRVRIIAFSSEKAYKPYRASESAFAYYQPGRERDYVVMQDIETDHQQVAMHEYTHLIVRHLKMNLPVWLNEGMADLYSTLEPRGKQAMVGRALPQRVAPLQQRSWMDWNTLLAVDQNSPYYNERERSSIFYAQSWALTHMLALKPGYMNGFPRFLASVAEGTLAPEALRAVYGKSVSEVGKDVVAYAHQATFKAALFDVTLGKTELETNTRDLGGFEVDLALAQLLASTKGRAAEAEQRLLALQKQNGQAAEVDESLGYLAWQQNRQAEAREHFASAVNSGSQNARMLRDYAGLMRAQGASNASVTEVLQKAIAADPADTETRLFLGELEASAGHCGPVLGTLASIHKVMPDQAFRFFSLDAYCHAVLRDPAGARVSAEKARQYAKTLDEKYRIDKILQSLASPGETPATQSNDAKPVASLPAAVPTARNSNLPRVSGKTVALECANQTYRLRVRTTDREMVFDLGDPKSILVRNRGELEWNCGALAGEDVTVVYQPAAGPKVDGKASELVF